MSKYTRGEFLGFGAALAGAFAVGSKPAAAAQAEQPATSTAPDLLVVNDAEAGFFRREARELLGQRLRRRRHRVYDAIDFRLGALRQDRRRPFGADREVEIGRAHV